MTAGTGTVTERIVATRRAKMGLDGVELVMALEEAFGIAIPNSRVADCRTPGMMADVIWSMVGQTDDDACRSQQAFYLLRRALMRHTKLTRGQITLDTRLRDLGGADVFNAVGKELDARNWPSFRIGLRRIFFKKVKDLIAYVETSNKIKWRRADVAAKVKAITIEQLGIPEKKYSETADFVRDLGV